MPENLPANLFRTLFEKSPSSVLLKADPPHFTILAASDDFLRINCVNLDEILGKGFFEAFPENNKDLHGDSSAFEGFMQVVTTGQKLYIPFLRYDVLNHETNTFAPHYWRCTNMPILCDDKKVGYIFKTIIDITDEIKAKEARAESESRLLLAAEATGLAIWDLDLRYNKFSCTPQLNGLFGQPDEAVLTLKQVRSQIHPDDMYNVVIKAYNESMTNGDYLYEVRVIWPDGSLHWLKTQGRVLFNENYVPTRMLGTVIEITESKRDEIRKNDFIAMASHELKTPLTSLKAYIQLLELKLNGSASPFVSSALSKAGNQVNKMTALIHSFLDLSKLEPGKLQLRTQDFDINKLIEETVAENRLFNGSHMLDFTVENEIYVNADREKIGQVIGNIMGNAIKYSPNGSKVSLRTEIINGQVLVSIADQGIGIKAKDQEKIFQRFYRADKEELKNISGFGIGLYLSSEIIQRHKGTIWVSSEENAGSTFYFNLPLSTS